MTVEEMWTWDQALAWARWRSDADVALLDPARQPQTTYRQLVFRRETYCSPSFEGDGFKVVENERGNFVREETDLGVEKARVQELFALCATGQITAFGINRNGVVEKIPKLQWLYDRRPRAWTAIAFKAADVRKKLPSQPAAARRRRAEDADVKSIVERYRETYGRWPGVEQVEKAALEIGFVNSRVLVRRVLKLMKEQAGVSVGAGRPIKIRKK